MGRRSEGSVADQGSEGGTRAGSVIVFDVGSGESRLGKVRSGEPAAPARESKPLLARFEVALDLCAGQKHSNSPTDGRPRMKIPLDFHPWSAIRGGIWAFCEWNMGA